MNRRRKMPLGGAAAVLLVAACVIGALSLPAPASSPYEAPKCVRKEGPVAFTLPLAVTEVGGGTSIRFAVSAETDVEVAVLDKAGGIVRHLAAGLLGAVAPMPLKRNSLTQDIAWDGKDDQGKLAEGGPFTVRVRIGTTPKLSKIAGWNGNTFGRAIMGLTVGPKGEVFVLISNNPRGHSEVRVLDRNGRYVRTIMPCSTNTPLQRRESLGLISLGDETLPMVYHFHTYNTAPLTAGLRRQNMAYNPRGHVILISSPGSLKEQGGPRHLLALHPEGGAPTPMDFVGPRIVQPVGRPYSAGMSRTSCFDHAAVSPDGRWIYLAMSTFESPHCVFRLDADRWPGTPGAPVETLCSAMEEGFVGRINMPGAGERQLNDPQGLAVDAAGNLYICDRGNGRVVIASPEGTQVATFPVDSPEQIGVHRETGIIYVLSRKHLHGRQTRDFDEMSMKEYTAWLRREEARCQAEGPAGSPQLRKFSPYGKGPIRELAMIEAPIDLLALDPGSTPAKLWASTMRMRPGIGQAEQLRFPEGTTRGELTCITDRGDHFEVGEPVSNEAGLRYPWFVSADPKGNRVLIREDAPYPAWPEQVALREGYKPIVALDLDTNRITPFLDAAEAVFAPDGSVYAIGRPQAGSSIYRFDGQGRSLPWPGSDSNRMDTPHYSIISNNQIGGRGFAVAANGDIYFIRSNKGRPERGVFNRVDIYSPNSGRTREAVIDGLCAADCGIDVDAAGNIYIGANVKSPEHPWPAGVAGLPLSMWSGWKGAGGREKPWLYSFANYYLFAWGSVFKFGPEGGTFYGRAIAGREPGKDAADAAYVSRAPADAAMYQSGCLIRPVAVTGVKWRFAGASPVPSGDAHGGDATCICVTSRLAADAYGRVFVPDAFRFSVWVLDTNGNLLGRIGRYGNVDDARSGTAIHFSWPAFVDESSGRLFVTDCVNRCVTVIDLDCQAEQRRAVPGVPASAPLRPPAAAHAGASG